MGRSIQCIKESTHINTRGIMKTVIHSLLVSFAVSLPQGYYYPYPYSYPVYRVVQPQIYTSQISYPGSLLQIQNAPTEQRSGKINVEEKVKEVLNTKIPVGQSIKASNDLTSPSAAAALAYMKSVSKDELCGLPTEVYLKTIFDGKSKEEANAEATRIYIEAYNSGKRLPQSGACAAADAAYREAWKKGDDPILESALAFINAWPGSKEGNPCAVSGIDYMKAIINGKSHLEANTIATTAFANAFKDLSKQGKPLKDVACRDATKAFFEAIPEKPDPANAAAFYAFTDKIFEDGAPAFDPVCLSSLDAFIESYNAGDDLLTANLKSAQSFFREFAKGSNITPDSPCAAATLAYAEEITNEPSAPNAAAMIAYITEAVTRQGREFDPVCAAATEAYFDAYIRDKSEAAANEAATVAYLDTLDKNPNFDVNSACGKAAAAYIKEF